MGWGFLEASDTYPAKLDPSTPPPPQGWLTASFGHFVDHVKVEPCVRFLFNAAAVTLIGANFKSLVRCTMALFFFNEISTRMHS